MNDLAVRVLISTVNKHLKSSGVAIIVLVGIMIITNTVGIGLGGGMEIFPFFIRQFAALPLTAGVKAVMRSSTVKDVNTLLGLGIASLVIFPVVVLLAIGNLMSAMFDELSVGAPLFFSLKFFVSLIVGTTANIRIIWGAAKIKKNFAPTRLP